MARIFGGLNLERQGVFLMWYDLVREAVDEVKPHKKHSLAFGVKPTEDPRHFCPTKEPRNETCVRATSHSIG